MHTKNLNKFIVTQNQKLSDVFKATNVAGIGFVLDEKRKLIGVVTDGDIRRAALRGYSLDSEVKLAMNRDYFYVLEGTSDAEILASIPKKIITIPIVDRSGVLIGFKKYSELSNKNAIVTGVTGQDGAYLSQFLLSKGYTVYGAYRRTSNLDFSRLEYLGIKEKVNLIQLDLHDPGSIYNAFQVASPSEVYNLAAQSFVATSFNQPNLSMTTNALGANNILDTIRYFSPKTKYYQASTSELYGKVQEIPQSEKTPFYPRSPYAISKLAAYWLTVNYREAYGIFGCNGILFNHESPLRGPEFVTRKITMGAVAIKKGHKKKLGLGNMDAKRDWGYARDYVESMWLMLQQNEAEDFVVATGKAHSVREFAKKAFEKVDLDYRDFIETDVKSFRPTEVDLLVGDPSKAKSKLGWNPEKTSIDELIGIMVESDLNALESGK